MQVQDTYVPQAHLVQYCPKDGVDHWEWSTLLVTCVQIPSDAYFQLPYLHNHTYQYNHVTNFMYYCWSSLSLTHNYPMDHLKVWNLTQGYFAAIHCTVIALTTSFHSQNSQQANANPDWMLLIVPGMVFPFVQRREVAYPSADQWFSTPKHNSHQCCHVEYDTHPLLTSAPHPSPPFVLMSSEQQTLALNTQ